MSRVWGASLPTASVEEECYYTSDDQDSSDGANDDLGDGTPTQSALAS